MMHPDSIKAIMYGIFACILTLVLIYVFRAVPL